MSAAAELTRAPRNLTERKVWACYNSLVVKRPLCPNGAAARSNDPSTWSMLKDCLQAVREGRAIGVGIMTGALGNGFTLTAIDLDCAFTDPENVPPGPWSTWLLELYLRS
jgi:hypothetical protein